MILSFALLSILVFNITSGLVYLKHKPKPSVTAWGRKLLFDKYLVRGLVKSPFGRPPISSFVQTFKLPPRYKKITYIFVLDRNIKPLGRVTILEGGLRKNYVKLHFRNPARVPVNFFVRIYGI